MQEPDLIDLFIRPIHEAGLRYLVAGSVAAIHYGEPRLTIDVDIPLLLSDRDMLKISDTFCEPDYYCPPTDILAIELSRECRGHFNVIHIPTGLKADFYPANRDPTFAWAWQNKRIEATGSGSIYLAPPEYVILWKLIFYKEGRSEKHLRDISRILTVQECLEHHKFLMESISSHHLNEVWGQAVGFNNDLV